METPDNVAIYSILDYVKEGMVCCEIGVRSGQSSEAIMEKGAFVYMVDPWEDYDEYPERNYRHEEDYQTTLKKAAPFTGQYRVIRKKSDDALDDVPNSLDFIYIDGNHDEKYVSNDIRNYWPKLKSGGYMAGDDWTMGGVAEALRKSFDPQYVNKIGRNWIVQKP